MSVLAAAAAAVVVLSSLTYQPLGGWLGRLGSSRDD